MEAIYYLSGRSLVFFYVKKWYFAFLKLMKDIIHQMHQTIFLVSTIFYVKMHQMKDIFLCENATQILEPSTKLFSWSQLGT